MFDQVLAGHILIFASDSAREDGGGAYYCRIHCESISGLKATYGNAIAAGGGFHCVTTAEGVAAEVSLHTYL